MRNSCILALALTLEFFFFFFFESLKELITVSIHLYRLGIFYKDLLAAIIFSSLVPQSPIPHTTIPQTFTSNFIYISPVAFTYSSKCH